MAYRLRRDETLSDGVRRIALEQLTKAIGLLDEPGDDVETAVHDVRKSCKMLRGLVRLVRPDMGKHYRRANATFRDASRQLADFRDAHALLDTFDDLVAADREQADVDLLGKVRGGLAARADAASRAVEGDDQRVGQARELLTKARKSVKRWPLTDDVDVMAAGIAKTYGRGRDRLRDSMAEPSDEVFHDWRKRAKYTWYHVRLLRDAAPSVLVPLVDRFHDLSDLLGDDHDLAVLTGQFAADPDEFGGADPIDQAMALIARRRADLQQRAWRLGARLYVESPDAFATRLVAYWQTWQEHGDELAAGEMSDLGPPADELDERSVRQLYAIAQGLDIAGRSSMNRAVLIASIRGTGWTEG